MNKAREVETGASPITLAPPMVSVLDAVEISVTTYCSTMMMITELSILFFVVVPYEGIYGFPEKLPCCCERRGTLQGSQPWESFSRQECGSGLLSPPPGDLTHPGIKHKSPVSPALKVDSLTEPPGKPSCESWPVPFPLVLLHCVFETIKK